MSQLVVRNIEPPLVLALKQRAARLGHSAEEEHRRILEEALKAPRKRSFAEFLAAMPDVGSDEDFDRHAPVRKARSTTARKSPVSRSRKAG